MIEPNDTELDTLQAEVTKLTIKNDVRRCTLALQQFVNNLSPAALEIEESVFHKVMRNDQVTFTLCNGTVQALINLAAFDVKDRSE